MTPAVTNARPEDHWAESIPVAPSPNREADLDALALAVRHWHEEGGVAVHRGTLAPGPWLDLLNALLFAQAAVSGVRPVGHGAALWLLDVADGLPRLARLPSLPQADATALIPTSRANVSIKAMMWLRRAGVKRLWMLEDRGWTCADPSTILADLLVTRRIKPLLRRLCPGLPIDSAAVADGLGAWMRRDRHEQDGKDSAPSPGEGLVHATIGRSADEAESAWRRFIEADNKSLASRAPRPDRPLCIVQYTGCLYSGGAERQLCNTAIGLHQRGHRCIVRTQHDLSGQHAHYLPLLAEAGVEARRAGRGLHLTRESLSRVRWDLVAAAPEAIRSYVAALALELAVEAPDVLHAWLDHPNVIAGLAGIAAGVPCVVLSTRNYNPTHFPRFYAPFVDWYRVIAPSRRLQWLANSHRGAASYAEYLGVEESRFHIVFNGLFRDHFDRPAAAQRRAARERLGLPAGAPVVAVVSRLDEEKQPELMLKVVTLLRERLPGVRVVVAGSGPLEARVREIIARRHLEQVITLLGRVSDVVEIMSAADVLLLTSRYEGCPNVALEAQHIGLPVVATDAGGTRDAVRHGVTGFVCGVNDAAGLVVGLERLLRDPSRRERMGRAAQAFVDACFDLDQMVDLTWRIYNHALDGESGGARIETPRARFADAGDATATEQSVEPEAAPLVQTKRPEAVRT